MGSVVVSAVTSETAKVLAVSDLHIGYAENREIVDRLQPTTDRDWLLVAGDVAEVGRAVGKALAVLRQPVRHGDVGAGQPRAVVAPVRTR